MTPRKKKEPTFEAGMLELEALVNRLGSEELELEESVKLYEQGTALAAQLESLLAVQKKRMEMIDPDTAEIVPFEEKEHGIS